MRCYVVAPDLRILPYTHGNPSLRQHRSDFGFGFVEISTHHHGVLMWSECERKI